MDLPVRGQAGQPKTATGAPRGIPQVYNPNTHTTTAAAQPGKVVTLPGQQTAFGFNEGYTQLSGKLEYSAIDGRWLIRYVSPDARPDRYGGVAVLVPSGPMTGFRNGDFVTVQGRLEAAGSSSPVFTASALAPQNGAW
jgi:hypothetical protein